MQNIIIIIAILFITFLAIKTGFVKMVSKFVVEMFAKWTAKIVMFLICLIVFAVLVQLFSK